MEELARHGYRLSAGTLYPMLHAMEERGYLSSKLVREGKRSRRIYRATKRGRTALKVAQTKLRELFREVVEER